jgi:hypothetical protein
VSAEVPGLAVAHDGVDRYVVSRGRLFAHMGAWGIYFGTRPGVAVVIDPDEIDDMIDVLRITREFWLRQRHLVESDA